MTPASVRVSTDARSSIREQLARLKPTLGRSDLLASLLTAAQAESIPGVKHRRVEIFTDGQAADWNTGDAQGWKRLHDVLQKPAIPTDIDVGTLGPKQPDISNMSVNSLHCNRTQQGLQHPIALAAQIQNHGSLPSASCSFRWLVAGEMLAMRFFPSAGRHEIVGSISTLGVLPQRAEII